MTTEGMEKREGWQGQSKAKGSSYKWTWLLVSVLPIVLVIVLAAVGVVNPYYYDVLMRMGIAIIIAVSFNMVNGFSGQFSLGQAGFAGVGAYVASVLVTGGNPGLAGVSLRIPGFLSGLPVIQVGPYEFAPAFLLAALIGGLAAAMMAFLIGIPAFRASGDYLAVITLAFNMIIINIFLNLNYVGAARGLTGIPSYSNFVWVWLAVIAVIVVCRNLIQSAHGRAILAVRENEVAAELGGIDVFRYKLVAFTVGAFFAGIAGALLAFHVQFINPSMFDIFRSFDYLIMIYLGGIGSISGAALGAVMWTFLQEILRPILPLVGLSQEWRLVTGPVLLIILMIFRPKGLFQGEFPFIRGKREEE